MVELHGMNWNKFDNYLAQHGFVRIHSHDIVNYVPDKGLIIKGELGMWCREQDAIAIVADRFEDHADRVDLYFELKLPCPSNELDGKSAELYEKLILFSSGGQPIGDPLAHTIRAIEFEVRRFDFGRFLSILKQESLEPLVLNVPWTSLRAHNLRLAYGLTESLDQAQRHTCYGLEETLRSTLPQNVRELLAYGK